MTRTAKPPPEAPRAGTPTRETAALEPGPGGDRVSARTRGSDQCAPTTAQGGPMTALILTLLLLALVGVWIALENRRVHQAIDRYAQDVRLWKDTQHHMGESPSREEPRSATPP